MQYIANNRNKNKELLLKHFLELFQLYIFIFFFLHHFLSPSVSNCFISSKVHLKLKTSAGRDVKLSIRSNLI